MPVIGEARGYLQLSALSAFFNEAELDRYKTLFSTTTEMQSLFEADELDQEP